MEPRFYAWIVPGRLAVAERPGRGGRSHRRALRAAEIAWWRDRGVTAIVSAMRTRHALVDYAEAGLAVRWHPLADVEGGRRELAALVAGVRELLAAGPGAVLVHVDLPGEWLAAVDAALRLGVGAAPTAEEALRDAAGDGLPVGSLAASLLDAGEPAAKAASTT